MEGDSRTEPTQRREEPGTLFRDLGHHHLLGTWEGSVAWSLNLFSGVSNTFFTWGCYKHPSCPQQFAPNGFIDSFSYNFPQKPVVK